MVLALALALALSLSWDWAWVMACLLLCFPEVKVGSYRKVVRLLSQLGSWAFVTGKLQPTGKEATVEEKSEFGERRA